MRSTVPAIVLAAGQSRRMGRPKSALAAGNGHTFASRIAATLHAAGASPIVFATSVNQRQILEEALGPWRTRVVIIENPHPERGQLSTLRCALKQMDAALPATLVTLVDVPFTTAEIVAALVDASRAQGAPVVRPACGNQHGHPIVIAAPAIRALLDVDAEVHTVRDVLATFASERREIAVDEAWRIADIDTPEEYEEALHHLTTGERRSDGRGEA
jgi:CTP:molybdopterin cytidylyltransferase MocA